MILHRYIKGCKSLDDLYKIFDTYRVIYDYHPASKVFTINTSITHIHKNVFIDVEYYIKKHIKELNPSGYIILNII